MSRYDLIAILFSLLAIIAAFLVANHVFENMAHIEDEIAFVWQARVMAKGYLSIPSPKYPKSFLVPFVVDYEGKRFSKYPVGWPVVLSFGIRLGVRELVNPLLAGFGVWLTYLLGKRTLGELTGLLAAGLTVASPFFLLNSGSLLSHPLGLVLSAAFALTWLDNFSGRNTKRKWRSSIASGMLLGLFALTRPLSALGVAIPFGIHGLYLLIRGDRETRKHILVIGIITLVITSLLFVWQFALTGDPMLNPYTLWWPYDKVGFGEGFGRFGHNLNYARYNTTHSIRVGTSDLFGWGKLSWIFLPFGIFAIRRKPSALLLSSVFFVLVFIYLAYWIGAWVYGPRYYYEGLYSLTLLTAAGIIWLAGWGMKAAETSSQRTLQFPLLQKLRPLMMTMILSVLVIANLVFYLPLRLRGMVGLYGVKRSNLDPFLAAEAQGFTPALVIVHPDHWAEYGGLLEIQSPFNDDPLLIVITRSEQNNAILTRDFADSGRTIYHYNTTNPGVFFTIAGENP
jgi:4-amino-4-deoxy-L-arabinose transferase-like glycosyltransferase